MYNMVSGFTNQEVIDADGNEETQGGDLHSVATMKPLCVVTRWPAYC